MPFQLGEDGKKVALDIGYAINALTPTPLPLNDLAISRGTFIAASLGEK